jgi:flagellar hook-associated protein 2
VSNSNTITNAISGVTINLNAVNNTSYSGTPVEGEDPWNWQDPPVYESTAMNVEADTSALKEKITSFVSAYNGVMEWILSGYDEFGSSSTTTTTDTGTEETLLGSTLRGDATINTVKRQLQNALSGAINNTGSFKILSQIGISTNLDGTLTQDNTTLDAALSENYDDMVSLLSGDDQAAGVMKNFNSLLLNLTSKTDGIYANQKNAYDTAIDKIDTQIDSLEARMTKRETTLKAQFSTMEQLVSSLNSQGDYLTQQLNALTSK